MDGDKVVLREGMATGEQVSLRANAVNAPSFSRRIRYLHGDEVDCAVSSCTVNKWFQLPMFPKTARGSLVWSCCTRLVTG